MISNSRDIVPDLSKLEASFNAMSRLKNDIED